MSVIVIQDWLEEEPAVDKFKDALTTIGRTWQNNLTTSTAPTAVIQTGLPRTITTVKGDHDYITYTTQATEAAQIWMNRPGRQVQKDT